mgnify:CR=1 FL=1
MGKLKDHKSKLVIITGPSKGLGLDIFELLLNQTNYILVGISRTCSKALDDLIKQFPERAFFKSFDFNNISDIKNLVTEIRREHGIAFALINNAAIGHDGILGTMHEKEIKEVINVNISAPIVLTKYVSRLMLTQGEGRVINIGSIIGKTGFNGLSVYGASKSAMDGFTKSLARELGKANITVNLICPGYMKTEMTEGISKKNLDRIINRSPLSRLAETRDISEMVSYLISEKSVNITGSSFIIDAGSTS